MNVKHCTNADCPELADLNKQLIEDEGSDNPMSVLELQTRMEGFISTEYDAYLFSDNGKTIGYALVNPNTSYLRQFFICRDCRNKGYGRAAFQALLDVLKIAEINVDCLAVNSGGLEFWKRLGFEPRYVNMRLTL